MDARKAQPLAKVFDYAARDLAAADRRAALADLRAGIAAEAERNKRGANEEHRISVRVTVDAAIMGVSGISSKAAEKIVTAIETGEIPHVTINF